MGMTEHAVGALERAPRALLGTQQQHGPCVLALAASRARCGRCLQVVMLGVGAWLVIDMQASAGVMIAATILLSRALQPVEHLISGWRTLLDARGAWRRLEERPTRRRSERT